MEEKFKAYELVRELGAYNMFSPKARELAQEFCELEIEREDWIYIIKNYEELREKFV
jgi:hypothetical protein